MPSIAATYIIVSYHATTYDAEMRSSSLQAVVCHETTQHYIYIASAYTACKYYKLQSHNPIPL